MNRKLKVRNYVFYGVEDRGDDYYFAIQSILILKMCSYFFFFQEDEVEGL